MTAGGYAVRGGRIAREGWIVGRARSASGVELSRAGAAADSWGGMRRGMNGVKAASAMKTTGAKPAAVETTPAPTEAATAMEGAATAGMETSTAETAASAAMKSAAATAGVETSAATTVETAATAAVKSAATTATAVTSARSAATGRLGRIRKQRHRCCGRENCDQRQPHVFAGSSSHGGSHLASRHSTRPNINTPRRRSVPAAVCIASNCLRARPSAEIANVEFGPGLTAAKPARRPGCISTHTCRSDEPRPASEISGQVPS